MITHPIVLKIDSDARRYTDLHARATPPAGEPRPNRLRGVFSGGRALGGLVRALSQRAASLRPAARARG